jgi:hypothetical protein
MKTCEEISVLYEQSKINRISIASRLAIRSHRSICKGCRQYFKDSDNIDSMITRKFKNLGSYTFSVKEKEELKDKLNKL